MNTTSNLKTLSARLVAVKRQPVTKDTIKIATTRIFYMVKGVAQLKIDNQDVTLNEKDVLLLNANSDFSVSHTADAEWVELQLTGFEITSLKDISSPMVFHVHRDDNEVIRPYLDLLLAEADQKTPNTDDITRRLVEIILIHVLSTNLINIKNSAHNKNYHEIIIAQNFLRTNFNRNISLEDLAELTGINKFYLIRVFKQQVGMSPIDFLIRVRMEEAQRLLIESNMAVSDISLVVGFQSPSHFSKTFREMNNCTPSQYRRQAYQSLLASRSIK